MKFYYDCILCLCAAGFKPPLNGVEETVFQKGDYSCEILVAITRSLLHLMFSGNFLFSFIAPCHAFLRSCSCLQNATAELASLYAAADSILNAAIPALVTRNDQPLHVVLLPRAVFELTSKFGGLVVSQTSAQGITVENVIASLGWCEQCGDGTHRTGPVRVSLTCGAILDALNNCPDQTVNVADLAAATKLPFETVSICTRTLVDSGFIQGRLPAQTSRSHSHA